MVSIECKMGLARDDGCGDYFLIFHLVPMWMTLPAVAGYSVLGVWLLNGLPLSFTIGEAMIVSQALTILFMDAALQLLTMVCT